MGMKGRLARLDRDRRRSGLKMRGVATSLERARSLHADGDLIAAEMVSLQALEADPGNFEANQLLGVISLQKGQPQQAIACLARALENTQAPTQRRAQAEANLGTAFMSLGQPAQALEHYDRALTLAPGLAGVQNNRGTVLQRMGRHDEAASAFEQLLALQPDSEFALGNRFHAMRCSADWNDHSERQRQLIDAVVSGAGVDRPFTFLAVTDSAGQQLSCARSFAARYRQAAAAPLWNGECYEHDRIRIAYVSPDFSDHVVCYLLAPLLEQHDAACFETLGVALAPPDGSAICRRARAAAHGFIDVSALTDEHAAALLRQQEVDIAVDLTGYTQGCRPGIFARRPAPVQVNFLGFPGTMGASFMDYIIADAFLVPEASRSSYSECIAALPISFQPNDARRSIRIVLSGSQRQQARRETGLPPDALILCNFNNTYKLTPLFFDIWLRLLQRVPASILWLLGGEPAMERRLRQRAAAQGIAPERLVFAGRVSYAEHLRRLSLADLFLDTLPFNAGATASDALWAGVPLLTCAGEAFAARMAGSLLLALDTPELVTFSPMEYEQRATDLLQDPARLGALTSALRARLEDHPLFDGQRYCRALESAFRRMWRSRQNREAATSFAGGPCRRYSRTG